MGCARNVGTLSEQINTAKQCSKVMPMNCSKGMGDNEGLQKKSTLFVCLKKMHFHPISKTKEGTPRFLN